MLHSNVVRELSEIQSERLVLRPVRKSDAGLLELYAGDKRVAENTRSIPHPLPPGSTQSFVERAMSSDDSQNIWVLDGSHTGLPEVLGTIALEQIGDDRSEIGYWVAPAFWNAGYASEAVKAILAANPQDVSTIFAAVFQSNPASARLLTNSGFDYIGDAEAFSVAQNRTVATWTYLKKMR